jgi:uncharacterized protein YuzE
MGGGNMKKNIYYDKVSDIKWIVIAEGEESYTEDLAPNVVGEYNANGQLIGIEIQNASKKVENFTLNSSTKEKVFTHSEKNTTANIILSEFSDKKLSGATL